MASGYRDRLRDVKFSPVATCFDRADCKRTRHKCTSILHVKSLFISELITTNSDYYKYPMAGCGCRHVKRV